MSVTFAVGDILKLMPEYALDDDLVSRALNVVHYRIAAIAGAPGPFNTVMSELAEEFFDNWLAAWQPAASEDVSMVSMSIQSVFPVPRSNKFTYVPGAAQPGNIVSPAIPLQDSPTILKITDFGQRWGRGRLFFVGVAESQQNGGLLNDTAVTAINVLGTALGQSTTVAVTGGSLTIEPVLVGGPEDNPTRVTKITSTTLSDRRLKTQRRRRPGKGS